MRSAVSATLLLLSLSQHAVSSPHQAGQAVLAPPATEEAISTFPTAHGNHVVDDSILAALKAHSDPVDALISLQPELAEQLAERRLIHVFGEAEAKWMTEGDKLRLRREGKKFRDITDHQELYADSVNAQAGKANLPKLSHQRLVKPLFPKVSTKRMHDVLKHLTSFYNRYFAGPTGEESSVWLHDQVASIIAEAPYHTHISLEYFTHRFPQSSIIARFEPKVRNFSNPLTIIGAHQDSANYLFPLLPAPGADDDGSGSVSILEAFRVLAHSGFIPKEGPVEFHWYAAEEGGLLGSQDIAAYKKAEGANIGAMMEFDMTAFIAKNATESIGFIKTDADAPLTKWAVELSTEYISIPTSVYALSPGAGSDYMSYTKAGFPATFAAEGNPVAGGFPGEFDPYVHGVKDTMDVDDETGYFSIDGVVLHLLREESLDPSSPDRWHTEVVASGEGETFSVPSHWHATHSEIISVREGRIEATLDGATHILSAGDSIHIPKYAVHQFRGFKGERTVVTEVADPPGDYKAAFFNDFLSEGYPPSFWHTMRTFLDGDGYPALGLYFKFFDVAFVTVFGNIAKLFVAPKPKLE
ncbi:hypothetical protein N0V93_008011 [Gnomoniopsis smithogilvyi]|uniref:Peptide hydrolase n=1 Tax=Gnomoniopsis smithogilvyi TaxID=1191159 RepID=A0A9W8YM57_9PEZI|nr:hypothetical protein N0V93_008011 [Gnomoniopsis smithogilvyi]